MTDSPNQEDAVLEKQAENNTEEALQVDPDLAFVQTITEWGGGDLKACFQCAMCSVVCPLSPDTNPFPCKEII